MSTLYITEQNTVLRKSGERFILCKHRSANQKSGVVRQSNIILDLPCADVDHVMIYGNIQLTTAAIRKMLEKGVELALFSFTGKLLGQLTPTMPKNINLRYLQYQKSNDPGFVLSFCREIIKGKVENAIQFLKHFSWNHPQVLKTQEIKNLSGYVKKIGTAQTIDELRGIEGYCASLYFALFGRLFKAPWQFTKRTKRPPQDPVNSVLSYGYVIISTQLQALIDGLGLDPYLGFYHQMLYGRPSLALDLVEEFRRPLIDRLAVNLFNKDILKEDDFFKPPRGGVYINNSGKKKFFEHFEKMMGDVSFADGYMIDNEQEQKNQGYYQIYREQIRKFIKYLEQGKTYTAYKFK